MLGLVPAKLRTRVINTRSMLVLLNAEDIVKPPIRSMMVGENMIEKTHLFRKKSAMNAFSLEKEWMLTWSQLE